MPSNEPAPDAKLIRDSGSANDLILGVYTRRDRAATVLESSFFSDGPHPRSVPPAMESDPSPPPHHSAPVRMAIISRDRMKAELLRYFFTTQWGFEVVSIEFTGADGIAAVIRTKPDIVLVALPLPDLDAAQAVRLIGTSSPNSKIIGLLTQCTEYLLYSLGGTGYQGLISDTDESLTLLGEVIKRGQHGLRTISQCVANCQASLRNDSASFSKLLTDRELEVLGDIARSMSDVEIAGRLGVAIDTVHTHRKMIMHKLNIHTTPKLISYCISKGFNTIQPPFGYPRAIGLTVQPNGNR